MFPPHLLASYDTSYPLLQGWGAQPSQEVQFLPEIDAYLKLNPQIRVSAQAKDTREGGDSTQAEIGPSVEFYLKPLVRLREITLFDLDDAKARPLVLATGYRYLAHQVSPRQIASRSQ